MNEEGRQRTWWSRALAAAYLVLGALAVAAGATTATPDLVAVVLFGALLIAAENSFVLLPSETSVSPSLMVVLASITAFDGEGTVVGAAAVGFCGGLVVDLFRGRRFRLVVTNCAQFVTSAAVAGAAFDALRPTSTALAIGAACVAFGVINAGLILIAIAVEYRQRPSKVWADMAPALPNYLAFGLLGVAVGELYESMGALALALLLTPLMIARATFSSVLALRSAREATVTVFVKAIEAKDLYTARHTDRVCTYSVYIGEELGFGHNRLERLRQSALLHDIGKLAVPKHLLNKPAKLTDEEFALVQRHAHVCIDILAVVDFLEPMIAAAAGHHARYDGGGYGGHRERGRDEFPLEAYIVAVADAFDAMTSTRSYRRALPQDVAFAELRAKSGTQFHPGCVEALIAALERRGEKHGLGYEDDAVDFEVPPPVAGVGSAGLGDREPASSGASAAGEARRP